MQVHWKQITVKLVFLNQWTHGHSGRTQISSFVQLKQNTGRDRGKKRVFPARRKYRWRVRHQGKWKQTCVPSELHLVGSIVCAVGRLPKCMPVGLLVARRRSTRWAEAANGRHSRPSACNMRYREACRTGETDEEAVVEKAKGLLLHRCTDWPEWPCTVNDNL